MFLEKCTYNNVSIEKDNIIAIILRIHVQVQHAKKIVSDKPGLVDFAVGLSSEFCPSLARRQVKFLGKILMEIQITEVWQEIKFWGASENDFWASTL